MLLFHEEFRAPIIRRAKTVTRRSNLAWRLKTIKVGRVHGAYVRPPWMGGEPFAQLLILGVTESDFLTVDEREARREGFQSVLAMRAYLLETHGGSYDFSEPVARIEFRLTRATTKNLAARKTAVERI